jgi:hypothetical protein
VLDALDFLDRHAVGFLHVAAVLADDRPAVPAAPTDEPCITRWVLGMRAWISLMRSMARMSPVGFGELVGAVAGADGDGQRVAVGLLDEVGGLLGSVSSWLAVIVPSAPWPSSLSPFIGFERAQARRVRLRRDADGVRQLRPPCASRRRCSRRRRGLAVGFERAVHHHRGEAGADGAMQTAGLWPWSWCMTMGMCG